MIEIGPNLKEAVGFIAAAFAIAVIYWSMFR